MAEVEIPTLQTLSEPRTASPTDKQNNHKQNMHFTSVFCGVCVLEFKHVEL